MIKAMYTAAAGMTAQQNEVDVIANNLANVNTAGFKKSATHFEDLVYVTLGEPGAANQGASPMAGMQIGSGSRLVSTAKQHSQGTLAQTGNALDISIQGDGFFEIEGPGGTRLFTRDGHFTRNANGDVVTASGYRLVPAITIPQEASDVTVAKDGTVSYSLGDQNPQIGQITVTRFVNPSGLSSQGGNLYQPTAASGDPQTVAPGEVGSGEILQGFVERSNVDVATELIQLILAQRAFEVNSRAIRTSDEMLSTTNQLTQ